MPDMVPGGGPGAQPGGGPGAETGGDPGAEAGGDPGAVLGAEAGGGLGAEAGAVLGAEPDGGPGGLSHVGGLLDAAVRARGVPGAVAAVGRGPVTFARWAAGLADTTAGAVRPMTTGTVFDLASLTKVVATATATLALAGQGLLGLDDPVTGYLPGFTGLGRVTIRHLLTHTSGLPATREFYRWCGSPRELLEALRATQPEALPGSRVVYSDLGFILLGEVVAAVSGERFDVAVRRLVTGPLGMRDTGFTPPGAPGERFAATEPRDDGTPWTGIVHDENARVLGGIAGHAGLFSTLGDLALFAAWWAGSGDGPVPAPLRAQASRCQTEGLDGRRGLGWMCARDASGILGPGWPPSAVSHTGFTGTSIALDPGSGLWVVLLTNAVHFGRDHTAIKVLRRELHAAVAAWATPGILPAP
ncbi:MAG: beta-lactamase family protein [Streptosporangiaceae bacterium]|nr:beta-lactamase family protein [Streptosporangiaceae bacterium]MBV9855366.1 beta-lactamase family protein [Streptosporangiaceae bacterium]